MYDSPFAPLGPTYLVGISAVNVVADGAENATSYRVRNLSSSAQYLTWGNSSVIAGAIPSAGNPTQNMVGLLPSSVEVFSGLPANVYFIASAAAAFEITPGEGS